MIDGAVGGVVDATGDIDEEVLVLQGSSVGGPVDTTRVIGSPWAWRSSLGSDDD